VWYSKNAAGVWDAYIGTSACQGAPLLPAFAGNRGPADITSNGRYVLLTTAVGWDKALPDSSPGRGSQNAIQLYDRQTGKISTLLVGATTSQRGVIWPKFNANATQIVWSQMLKTASEAPPVGQWALHVADVNLAAGTISNNVEWQDPDGQPEFYEVYGWVPNSDLLIFMSTTRATTTGFGKAQLFTLPDTLGAATTPTRISPAFAPVWPWQSAVDVYHEFASFAPSDPNTLYTAIGADTVGGDDLFSYDLRTQQTSGRLGQPTRISYFGGDLNRNWGTQAIPGWPQPSYTVVTTMAWVNGGWLATTCPDILCEHVNAWRINLQTAPSGGESRPTVSYTPPAQPSSSATLVPTPATLSTTKKATKKQATASSRACRASGARRGRTLASARTAARTRRRVHSRCAARSPRVKHASKHAAAR
jgi:hypothetical protein